MKTRSHAPYETKEPARSRRLDWRMERSGKHKKKERYRKPRQTLKDLRPIACDEE